MNYLQLFGIEKLNYLTGQAVTNNELFVRGAMEGDIRALYAMQFTPSNTAEFQSFLINNLN